MLKSAFVWPSVLIASLTLAACAPASGPLSRSASSAGSAASTTNTTTATQQATPVQYSDIPVPKGRKINVDKTVVVGTDVWYGQLTYDTNHSSESMFAFYTRELPNYGWRKITSAQAHTSILAYNRGNRVMTMAITPNRIRGSEVMITVSPKEGTKPFQPAAPAATPTPAPVTLAPPPMPLSQQPQR